MKYICILNGKEYEVEVRRVDDFTPLTRADTVSSTPAASSPAPVPEAN